MDPVEPYVSPGQRLRMLREKLGMLRRGLGGKDRKPRRKNGIGKTKIKLAEMIKEQLKCSIEPEKFWMNRSGWSAQMDLCRWGCEATRENGRKVNVHSWDKMGAIVKCGKIAVVCDDGLGIEICSGSDEDDEQAKKIRKPL